MTDLTSTQLFHSRIRRVFAARFARIIGGLVAGLVILVTVAGSLLYASVASSLPDVTKLEHYDPARTSKIFASDGTLIATLFDENRTYTKIDKISPLMVASLVAIEDRRFYEHPGVDLKGIARALSDNFTGGQTQQGASTLTMQLARKIFLPDERTYARKVREAVLAHRIDREFSKEKILELYLNEVYFGAGAYGIDAAAAVYFGTNPDKLELWQAAMLAGLVQAPTTFSPLVDKKAAIVRMQQVLEAMENQGKATPQMTKQALRKAQKYSFVDRPLPSGNGMLKYPYFSTYAIRQLSERYPENYVRRGGMQVLTTLDRKLQGAAEQAVRRAIEGPGKAVGADTAAVVVLDNLSGDILAMVGGPAWSTKSQFNSAWQAYRQPGSAFKMFVYAAALEAGYDPEQELADTEATFSPGTPGEWKPSNSDGRFMGAVPLRTGLQFSRNLVAAKLVAHIGPSKVVTLAHRMGIESDLPEVVSLALGAGEVTPLQMARAFSVLPSGGVLRPSHALKQVTAADGRVLANTSRDNEVDRVISKQTAQLMCEMLHRVVTGGTATSANISNTFVGGKTGTTDNYKDAWFCGFTPHHTIVVWVGREDNKPMDRVYGGTLPADIFREVAQAALAGHDPGAPLPGVNFEEARSVQLCWDTTYLAAPTCPKSYREVFRTEAVPTRVCPAHRSVDIPLSRLQKVERGDSLSSPQPGSLSPPQLVLRVEDLPDDLNPRKDPEVISASRALIPYVEKTPSLDGVKFRILGEPGIVPSASSTPYPQGPGSADPQAPLDTWIDPDGSGEAPTFSEAPTDPQGVSTSGEGDPALSVPEVEVSPSPEALVGEHLP